MHEYQELGHIQEINAENESDVTYYIPHHSVYRPENSTTKFRVVFSAPTLTLSFFHSSSCSEVLLLVCDPDC